MSPSVSNALKMAAAWMAIACVGIFGLLNPDLVRDTLGFRIEAEDYGRSGPAPESAPSESSDEASSDSDNGASASGSRVVQLKAGPHGHFFSRIQVNGRGVDAMVDTGASIVALTFEDAERAGIHVRDPDFTHRVSTANGVARVALVTLDTVAIEDITVHDVRAAVAERGKLTKTLLGMSFLSKLSRTEMSRGTLVLEE
jgi:aspartyl protease family protein